MRVDWFTPDGLPTWGDGRFTILGTDGYIELRKYRRHRGPARHRPSVHGDQTGTRHIDCSKEPISYFRNFVADVRDRTETAMPQAHVFTVCRLALRRRRGQSEGSALRSYRYGASSSMFFAISRSQRSPFASRRSLS